MIVEGVSFVEENVKKIKKRDFVDKHKGVLFQDRSVEKRESILSEVYNRIKGVTSSAPGVLTE